MLTRKKLYTLVIWRQNCPEKRHKKEKKKVKNIHIQMDQERPPFFLERRLELLSDKKKYSCGHMRSAIKSLPDRSTECNNFVGFLIKRDSHFVLLFHGIITSFINAPENHIAAIGVSLNWNSSISQASDATKMERCSDGRFTSSITHQHFNFSTSSAESFSRRLRVKLLIAIGNQFRADDISCDPCRATPAANLMACLLRMMICRLCKR